MWHQGFARIDSSQLRERGALKSTFSLMMMMILCKPSTKLKKSFIEAELSIEGKEHARMNAVVFIYIILCASHVIAYCVLLCMCIILQLYQRGVWVSTFSSR